MKKIICILTFFSGYILNANYYDSTTFKEEIIFSATLEGQIIEDKYSDIIFPIASLTKVMNVLVALEEVEKGNFSLNDNITFDRETSFISGGAISVWPGDSDYTFEDLIKVELVFSSNNAAYALAKHIGKGNIDNFIDKMNEKSKKIGLKDTIFVSPAGLPARLTNKNNLDLSTAKDMYLLTRYIIKNKPEILKYSSLKKVNFKNSKDPDRIYYNKNEILGKYGVIGLKTGFHLESMYNNIIVSKLGDSYVISVSFNSKTNKERFDLHKNILQNLENKIVKLVDKEYNFYLIDTKNHKNKQIEGYLKEDISLLDLGREYDIKINLYSLDNIKINKDDIIGKVEVYLENNKVVEKNIYSKSDNRLLYWYEKILRIITFGYY